ncbi:MAG: tRNA glutamyl-Q(34) synthetase GluQRS [Minwuia sp.]|nr:tRNA glutamyl-Q(34) synthetase GluQRS [Minwuia sp.]
MTFVTRFAPSPTGYLHIGHAFSAVLAHDQARAVDGRFLLRVEDIDHTRCRPEFVGAIVTDLAALGLSWDGPIWRQAERMQTYRSVLDDLKARELVYPCFCTRRQVAEASPGNGFDGLIYGGTCARLGPSQVDARLAEGAVPAWRLRLHHALSLTGDVIWQDQEAGVQRWQGEGLGDVVIARRDIGTSYHLAVTVDDAAQNISHVIRGKDLFHQTPVHVLLQMLLDLPRPRYLHHRLIQDGMGRKLSKSEGVRSLRDIFTDGTDAGSLVGHLRSMIAGASPWDSV